MKKFKLFKEIENAYDRDNLVFKYFGVLIETQDGLKYTLIFNLNEYTKDEFILHFDSKYNYNLEEFEGTSKITKWDYTNCTDDFNKWDKK